MQIHISVCTYTDSVEQLTHIYELCVWFPSFSSCPDKTVTFQLCISIQLVCTVVCLCHVSF
ncbi:MAG: hypothetical protein ACKPKO_17495, partial [Candidatus Fonsibacter sp.]